MHPGISIHIYPLVNWLVGRLLRDLEAAKMFSKAAERASETAGKASEPAERASEPAGRALDPAGRASDPAGRALDPADMASEPAGKSDGRRSGPAGRPLGRMQTKQRFPCVVVAAAQKAIFALLRDPTST